MKQVQSSGVLMVFSQTWVEELYHQVLERNMLGEAGYWGSPEEHSLPLITMLTGQYYVTVARLTSKHMSKTSYNNSLLHCITYRTACHHATHGVSQNNQ